MSIQLSTRVMHVKDQSTGSYDTIDVIKGRDAIVDDELSNSSENPVQNKVITKALKDKADIIISNASGAIASFTDGADGLPMESVVAHIEPVQSGTGDPSPTNIRPISGWTGANVVVSPTEDAQDGTTYTVSWQTEAGTVYGGTVDLVSGKLIMDRVNVDLGALSMWEYSSNYNCYFSYLTSARGQQEAKIMFNAVCSQYPFVGKYTLLTDKSCAYIYNQAIAVRDSSYSDVESFKAAMSGVQLVYELATPLEYDLTPQEITSLLGANNVWSDIGDVEVQYRADTKLYLESHAPKVDDVQVNGTSVVQDGVANIPKANYSTNGVTKIQQYGGLQYDNTTGDIKIDPAASSALKAGANQFRPVVPYNQHESTFYGLAKAASDTTQSQSSNTVGTYTDAAKKAIREMLGIPNFDSELIVDLTTTEDLAKLEITTDINGQSFNIWAAKIIIILPMPTTGATDYLSAMALGRAEDGTDKRWGLPTLRFNSGISQSIMAHELEMFGHGVYFERSYNGSRYDASTNTMNTYIPAETDIKCLYGLRLYQYSASTSLIPSGTRILIYGCRI